MKFDKLIKLFETYEDKDGVPTPIDTADFRAWFGDSVVKADGGPIIVHHGTSNQFDTFNRDKSNSQGFLGDVFYFSSSYEDSYDNYASPTTNVDLQGRIVGDIEAMQYDPMSELIERLKNYTRVDSTPWFEKLYTKVKNEQPELEIDGFSDFIDRSLDELESVSHDELFEYIMGKLDNEDTHEASVLECYLKIENPAYVGNGNKYHDFTEYIDDIDDYMDSAKDMVDDEGDYTEEDGDEYTDTIRSRAVELATDESEFAAILYELGLYDLDSVSYDDLFEAISTKVYEGDMEATTYREVYSELGFDGVILVNPSTRFKNMGLSDDTIHYHVFESNQVKSIHNKGTWSASSSNIYEDD